MPSPNICQPKIGNRVNCVEKFMDVTGDGREDLVTQCDKVTVSVKGPKQECTDAIQQMFPDINGEYGAGTLSFDAPLVELKKVGTSLKFCRDMRDLPEKNAAKDKEVKELRQIWGIKASYKKDGESEYCLIEPQKKGALWRLLSLPVRLRSLKIEDLRNEFMKELYSHDVNGSKVGIGSKGKIEMENGDEVSGIVANVGFYNPFFDPRYVHTLPKDRVKFYVFTEGTETRTPGKRVNLGDVAGMTELKPDEVMRLSIEFYEQHMSIEDLLEEIDKANK